MAEHDVPSGEDLASHRGTPVIAGPAGHDLADDDIDRPVEQVVLVPDVPIQCHRLDAELLAEPSHAQGVDAAAIGQVDGRSEHALPGQWRAAFGGGEGIGHLTSVRRTHTFTT